MNGLSFLSSAQINGLCTAEGGARRIKKDNSGLAAPLRAEIVLRHYYSINYLKRVLQLKLNDVIIKVY